MRPGPLLACRLTILANKEIPQDLDHLHAFLVDRLANDAR